MNRLTLLFAQSNHICKSKIYFLKIFISALLLCTGYAADAQKVEKMFVNLYTDSLKKGTHNYINVDGLMSTGNYLPLDSTKIILSCNKARFFGNSLVIPFENHEEKYTIKVSMRSDPKQFEEFVMYVKKAEDPLLKTESEVLAEMKANKKKKVKIKEKK